MQEIVKVTSGKDLLKSYANKKQARQIFGRYIHEGELCVLFGDSNAGKSILANDIAFFVSGGGHEWEGMESPNIPSLYIDMEMSGAQFARRYASAEDYIPEMYSRAEINTNSTDDKWNYIRSKIITMQGQPNPPKFIIIDNVTNGFGSIFSAKRMLALITEIKNLKERFKLTVLLIAHCPKRNKKKPISDNDLGGSKMILNFVDSAFAVGTSLQGENVRYVKQIKCRECSKDEEVMTVRIKGEPYLSMQYVDKTEEQSHIDSRVNDYRYYEISPEKEIELVNVLTEHLNTNSENYMSYYDIAELLNLPVDFIVWYNIRHFLTSDGED